MTDLKKSNSFAEGLDNLLARAKCERDCLISVKNGENKQEALNKRKEKIKAMAKCMGESIQAAKVSCNMEIYNDDNVKKYEALKNICDSF